MGGAVPSLEEDGDVPGDAGGHERLVAGGYQEGGGDGLPLADDPPDAPLVDAREEGCQAVVTDLGQTQPRLEGLADQGERTEAGDGTGLLGPHLAGLQLLGQLVHQLLQQLILSSELLTVGGLRSCRTQSGTELSLERSSQALRTKSCSVKDGGPPVSRISVSEPLQVIRS